MTYGACWCLIFVITNCLSYCRPVRENVPDPLAELICHLIAVSLIAWALWGVVGIK